MGYKKCDDFASFEAELQAAGDKPVFVDFMADWCGNCEKIFDNLEALASQYGDKAIYLQIDVDANEETAEKFEVTALPRVLCFKKGEKVGEMFGNKDEKYTEFYGNMMQ